MNRPNVTQIEGQRVESEREITGSEAEEILRRYGHNTDQSFSNRPVQQPVVQQPPQTFEEMVKQEEAKRKAEQDRRNAQLNGPKPITFEGQNGYESHTKYGSDDELGFGFKIEISTDMKLPKY
jgi:hypothetical protein